MVVRLGIEPSQRPYKSHQVHQTVADDCRLVHLDMPDCFIEFLDLNDGLSHAFWLTGASARARTWTLRLRRAGLFQFSYERKILFWCRLDPVLPSVPYRESGTA